MRTVQDVQRLKDAMLGGLAYRAEVTSVARPETVYGLIADLNSHLIWSGKMQKGRERLLSIQTDDFPIKEGSEFDSTGSDTFGEWTDHSIVTDARFPTVFEFVTDGKLMYKKEDKDPWRASQVHHFEVTPTESGSKIIAWHRSVRSSNAPALVRSKLVAPLIKRATQTSMCRTLENLAALAETKERSIYQ